ncbi:MAG TPA: hypothetical protein VL202_22950 [Pararhizobium sp.]|uniref:hypothetical protein n=1 Tax=Pararhizobium sp. TaxID=1977563 RepID=UPI002BD39A02|nr:hypothetical protein [Pararhizobium sp.]HTO34007.1 hypothetical protein [Pararhizobium sp.]
MRSKNQFTGLSGQLDAPDLDLVQDRNISKGVVAALNAAEARKRERIGKSRLLRHFMTEFSGSKGSALYKGLSRGDVVYVARRYRKTG